MTRFACLALIVGCWRTSDAPPERPLGNETSAPAPAPAPMRVASAPADAAIDAAPIVVPTNPTCTALFQQGQQAMSSGSNAAALSFYDQAYACEPAPLYAQFAFMMACATGNSPKAKQHYANLTPVQQTKFAQICIRQKPPVAYD